MQRLIAAAALMSLASLANAEPSIDCTALAAPQVMQAATDVVPVAGELALPEQPLGVAGGVLDQSSTGALSAEQVLYRQQLERCAQLATADQLPGGAMEVPPMTSAPVVAGEAVVAPGGVASEGMVVASVVPAAAPAPELVDAATYKPRTEFDNTPWRFNMNQNGERMTADAFAAWMEAKGVRVATGRAPAAAGELPLEDVPMAPEGAVEVPEAE